MTLDPCFPGEWDEVKLQRRFRGKQMSITIHNPDGVQKGVKTLTVNGANLDSNFIAADVLKDVNEIVLVMG